MLKISMNIIKLLDKQDRRTMALLVVFMCIVGVLEVAGVLSIMPFLAVVGSPDMINSNKILNYMYQAIKPDSINQFLIMLGVASLFFIIVFNLFSALSNWLLIKYSQKQWVALSNKLLKQYLMQEYEFFLNRNSSDLVMNIIGEVHRLINGAFLPILNIISKLVVLVFILCTLVIINPLLALSVGIIMGILYGVLFYLIKNRIKAMSDAASLARTKANRILNEALHGIKDIKLMGKESVVLAQYAVPTLNAARYETYHQTFLQAPRYAVDSISFGALIMVAIYYIMHDKVNLVMPIIGLYAFAAYRVMPALMQLFSGITTVKYNSACLINLLNEYEKTSNYTIVQSKSDQRIEFNRELTLRNLSYKYPFSDKFVFENVSLTIKANTTIGVIGESGSGKTTLVDVVMGLLNKSGGDIFVDGSKLTIEEMPAWRMNIGYVPQHIYLTDDTIKRNIAFGVPDNEIDMASVERAARLAKIHDFIAKELPEGFNTVAGERGVRLSGGQRQRIGIARALYYDPKILVMDEATSSLDNETEQAVMDAINELARKKTIIIIAHRMSTIDKCDYVYKVSEGRLDTIDKQ